VTSRIAVRTRVTGQKIQEQAAFTPHDHRQAARIRVDVDVDQGDVTLESRST
jgi:hypothetical protein